MNTTLFKRLSEKIKLLLHPDPVRDWFTLFTLSLILLAGIIVWNVWAFDTVVNGGAITAVPVSSTPVFNTSSLNTIHTIFATRAAENAKYMAGVYHVTDPSQ
ncbi:MAG TPA: hypothetical protein VMV38_01705 [Candidatus Paceibacterota bacterium]|nr:hypothetical protein [Candidatus Paceibacterota bacterium]